MAYRLEEIFHRRVRQLVPGSKVLLPFLACSSRSLPPLVQRSRRLSGWFHQQNDKFLGSVPQKKHLSSFRVVPARLEHPKISQIHQWPSLQTPTHNPRGVRRTINSLSTLVRKGIGQLGVPNRIYTYLAAASGAVERREAIGLIISHN